MSEKQLVIGLRVNTQDSAQQIESVRDAAVRFGRDGAAGADELARALQNIESAEGRVTTKISEGRAITVKDGSALVQQFELLKDAITRTFGSLASAPAEVQQAFQRAHATVDTTTAKIKTLTTATAEHKQSVAGNAAEWGGFSNQVLKAVGADGALGKAVIGIGGVTAAFNAGWTAGDRLNKFFGTDMSVWQESSARFGQKAGLIIRDLSDIVVAEFNAISALLHGNLAEAKRDFAEAGNDIFKLGEDMSVVLTRTGADWDKYTIGTGLATEANKRAQEAAAKLREEKQKLREEIDKVTKSLKAETDELNKQKNAQLDAEHGVIDQSSNLGYYKRQVDAATAALEEQRQKVDELTQRFGANNPMVTQAREKQDLLEQSLRSSQQRYDETATEVQKYEEQQRAAKAAVEKATEKVAELSKEQAKLKTEMNHLSGATAQQAGTAAQAATSTQAAATATDAHSTAASHAAPNIITYRDAAGRLHMETTNLADSASKAAASTEHVATATNAAATAAANAKPALSDLGASLELDKWHELDTVVGSVLAQLRELPNAAGAATDALHKLGEAGAKAAGTSDGSQSPGGGLPGYQTPSGPVPMQNLH